jgi:hypothetical protein
VSPFHIAAGVTIVAVFLGGAWVGRAAVKADWAAERAQQDRAVVAQMERSMERSAAADMALAGVQSAVAAALRSKPHAPPAPIPCPASGDARDAVLPGLGDRLRAIDAAAGAAAASGLEAVHGSGASDTGR